MSETLSLKIHLTEPEDTFMTIDVNPNAPIKDLKKEIDARANLRGKQKRLLLSGLFLSDNDQLSRYKWDIDPQPVIHVVMGEAWNINSSGNQPAPPQRRPGQAEARAGAGAAENAETREQKLTDLMTVATTRPNESGEILSQFNERLFPMLIPNTIPRFRKMLEMLPRSIVHQEIMRRLFLPDNITPSQVEEYTARLCSPEFRKAFDTLCQLDQVATDESDKENGNETDRILSQIAAKADMLENPDIGLDQLDEQGDFEPDPRLEGIIEHLRDTFFEDVDYGEPAEQQEGENGENAEEGVAAAIEQDVNAVNEGDNNATNNMNVNINANASANAVAAKLLDMGNEGGLDDETVAEVFQFQEIQEETERLRQKYAEGLKQLQDMGYTDEGQNLMVLDARNGDVAAAIEFLIVDE